MVNFHGCRPCFFHQSFGSRSRDGALLKKARFKAWFMISKPFQKKLMHAAFYQSELDQPHPNRARAIIKAHPEVRQLMVRNPYTAAIALSTVVLQTSIAFLMGNSGSITGGSACSLLIVWARS
jgi:hypothetical protein